MFQMLWVIPALPLAAFLALVLGGRRWPRAVVELLGVAPTAGSAFAAVVLACTLWYMAPDAQSQGVTTPALWNWISAGNLSVDVALHWDWLAAVMSVVITVVATLILVYSTEHMASDEGYGRFFAIMNLFVASMLILVLADNLLLLYLGWEGVGLCSYLLIGFWYRDHANVVAARKAFLVTRIGDTAFAIGIFLLFANLGTLAIHGQNGVLALAAAKWGVPGQTYASVVALLLLGGALGKSAQLPLQTWLPDAMAGPTPVSALIHAATMVTAGVYLIARMDGIFALAPQVRWLVAGIGAATLLYAAVSALFQRDIKRVLAYSTMSQVGYMFLALGVGAASAAIFHFVTHAFFKSLLFLSAGLVIAALHHEHDMFKMGGLRKSLPLAFWGLLIGSASLSALPIITAGAYSKDEILLAAWSAGDSGHWLWGAGVIGAVLTGIYSFRMVFLVFFGRRKAEPSRKAGVCEGVAIVTLSLLAIVGGVVNILRAPEGGGFLTGLLRKTFTGEPLPAVSEEVAWALEVMASVAAILGVIIAWWLYIRRRESVARLSTGPTAARVSQFFLGGWGFDWLYDRLLVRPFVAIAKLNRGDVVDLFANLIAVIVAVVHRVLSLTQSGRVRWYAGGVALGAIILLAIVVLT